MPSPEYFGHLRIKYVLLFRCILMKLVLDLINTPKFAKFYLVNVELSIELSLGKLQQILMLPWGPSSDKNYRTFENLTISCKMIKIIVNQKLESPLRETLCTKTMFSSVFFKLMKNNEGLSWAKNYAKISTYAKVVFLSESC